MSHDFSKWCMGLATAQQQPRAQMTVQPQVLQPRTQTTGQPQELQ